MYSGHSLICENGSLLVESKLFQTGIIYSDIDVERLLQERRRTTTFSQCAAGSSPSYRIIPAEIRQPRIKTSSLCRYVDSHPFVPSSVEERSSRCAAVIQLQAEGLAKRLRHIRCTSAVIGLSGGVSLKEVRIADSVRQHFKDIGQDENVHDVTYENGQARERTQVLMNLANKSNGIVIGTGDLSELALGWCTYNGDHMSMYGVNSSIPKTLVRYLVNWFKDEAASENPVLSEVLQDILDTPVSPELLPPKDGKISQKTEDLVGPYELHDFFLYYILRFGFSPEKILFLADCSDLPFDHDFKLKWLRTFYRRFFTQQFKRSCMPDGAKVGTVNLSPRGDWRMPSDASASVWLEEIDRIN